MLTCINRVRYKDSDSKYSQQTTSWTQQCWQLEPAMSKRPTIYLKNKIGITCTTTVCNAHCP